MRFIKRAMSMHYIDGKSHKLLLRSKKNSCKVQITLLSILFMAFGLDTQSHTLTHAQTYRLPNKKIDKNMYNTMCITPIYAALMHLLWPMLAGY